MPIIRINRLKNSDIINSTRAKDHRALFGKVSNTVFPIPVVKILVNVAAGVKTSFGKTAAFPITICTASASPKARAIPKIIAVNNPGKEARTTTLEIVCQRVAPNAKEASL